MKPLAMRPRNRFYRGANSEGRKMPQPLPPYGNGLLPAGIRSREVPGINGLSVHLLEAGFETRGRPLLLLLHGFPELAFSWRKVMLPLSVAGYHVLAPDMRGYGRTTGSDNSYDADLLPFGLINMVRDQLALVAAFGCAHADAVIGHDAGSPVAAWCAVTRPDVFRKVVMMSAPFAGTPSLPFNIANEAPRAGPPAPSMDAKLAALPRPRKYYQHYYCAREANNNMRHAPQGLSAFFRAYYHVKSADWKANKPHPLRDNSGEELARMPAYYIMDRDKGMAESVAPEMPSAAEIAACRWLTDDELAVYAAEYGRTGFQGGLQHYRRGDDPRLVDELKTFAGRTIDVPSLFISGTSDWGVYQTPGAQEAMRTKACTAMRGFELIEGAGHWVQQEQPEKVCEVLLKFLDRT
jgi:pimeloyl-ACP methyl ester carboxylesterase